MRQPMMEHGRDARPFPAGAVEPNVAPPLLSRRALPAEAGAVRRPARVR